MLAYKISLVVVRMLSGGKYIFVKATLLAYLILVVNACITLICLQVTVILLVTVSVSK